MSLSLWLAFLAASLLIAVSPGPGAATSMSAGLRHGYGAALRAIAGLQTALLLQLVVVFAGLGALLTTSAGAFLAVKLCGAAYLVWLGIQKWRAPAQPLGTGPAVSAQGLWLQGLLVNLSNPKAIVFMAALVPQFIDATQPQWPQFLVLAATMCGVDTLVMSAYALAAARLRPWLSSPRMLRAQNRFFGGFFVFAGTALASSSK